MFHESLTTTTDMAVLPSVLGCRPLRRTIQVRLETNPAVRRDGCPVARPPRLARMAGRQAHLRGLVTPIHETSGLEKNLTRQIIYFIPNNADEGRHFVIL